MVFVFRPDASGQQNPSVQVGSVGIRMVARGLHRFCYGYTITRGGTKEA